MFFKSLVLSRNRVREREECNYVDAYQCRHAIRRADNIKRHPRKKTLRTALARFVVRGETMLLKIDKQINKCCF